jgi:hypothetical protein
MVRGTGSCRLHLFLFSGVTLLATTEVDDPLYIIDLIRRVVTVSVETVQIVAQLPALEIME